jgi:hypothetical protein
MAKDEVAPREGRWNQIQVTRQHFVVDPTRSAGFRSST